MSDCEKVLGRDHPDTLAISAKLAAAYQAAGRMPSALQLFEQTCAESERVLGPDHTDTLTRRVNLAHLYYATGRVGDAIALLRETAARCELILPAGNPLIQVIQQSLANIAGDG
jgi:tetratricopeptide repeat protein